MGIVNNSGSMKKEIPKTPHVLVLYGSSMNIDCPVHCNEHPAACQWVDEYSLCIYTHIYIYIIFTSHWPPPSGWGNIRLYKEIHTSVLRCMQWIVWISTFLLWHCTHTYTLSNCTYPHNPISVQLSLFVVQMLWYNTSSTVVKGTILQAGTLQDNRPITLFPSDYNTPTQSKQIAHNIVLQHHPLRHHTGHSLNKCLLLYT